MVSQEQVLYFGASLSTLGNELVMEKRCHGIVALERRYILFDVSGRPLAGGTTYLAGVGVLRNVPVQRPRLPVGKAGKEKCLDATLFYGNPFETFELQKDEENYGVDEPCLRHLHLRVIIPELSLLN